jgi:hypothetical protein
VQTISVTFRTAVAQTLLVDYDGYQPPQGQDGFTVLASAPKQIAVVQPPNAASAGSRFPLIVVAEDAYGNVVSDAQGKVVLKGFHFRKKAELHDGVAGFHVPRQEASHDLKVISPWGKTTIIGTRVPHSAHHTSTGHKPSP